ncbi:MAG: DUF4870 domain-containing protein [Xanthomonadales bacterium]|nr:DUF4870 domain-containing protein [Xanthomonadales bacterium]
MTENENKPVTPNTSAPATDSSREANQWAMFIHFSVLAGFIVPFAGLILPIVLWQLKKDEFPVIDDHGKVVVNWIISALIYSVVCFILTFVIIGIFGFMALGLATVLFAIIGGIKANNGELWEYPLTIKIIK